jgi:alkylation response protein AidB-like acyl-CoA dehydrogenase
LLDADGGGVYANGHVLFVRQDGVYAQAFDAERLELAGRPFQVAEGIYGRVGGQSLTLSAGQSAFAFRSGATRNARQFTWVDRYIGTANTAGNWLASFYLARSGTIYAGTSQVQRNIIGDRILGLPREPRADTGSWKESQRLK